MQRGKSRREEDLEPSWWVRTEAEAICMDFFRETPKISSGSTSSSRSIALPGRPPAVWEEEELRDRQKLTRENTVERREPVLRMDPAAEGIVVEVEGR